MSAKSPATAEDVERLRIIDGLETDISSGDYMSFLRKLDNRGTGGIATSWEMEQAVVLEGFKLLRYHVLKSQRSNPNVVVLTGEGWVKTIIGKISTFENSRLVAVDGLLTLLTLSSLPGTYKNIIVRRGGINTLMKLMDDYREDREVCRLAGGLLLSLSLNEKEGLNATYGEIEMIIERLVLLISREGCGSDFALRVLLQFTYHKKKLINSTKSLSSLIKNTFREDKNRILALVSMMKNKNARESTVEAATTLLWRLSVPRDESGGVDPCLTSIDTMETIIVMMEMYDSVTIREAVCGILANVSIRTELSAKLVQKSFLSMKQFLWDTDDEGLATCALHAISNILEKPVVPKSLLLNEKMVEAVLHVMRRFAKSEELIEFACLIIGRGGHHDQRMKEQFVAMGAFDLVTKAFEEYVTSREEDPSLDVKDASLCAFATLTGCQAGALTAMSTGLIDVFRTLLAVETDRDFANILNAIINNAQKCATGSTVSTSPEELLRNEPDQFSRLIQNKSKSDSDVSSLIQVMVGTNIAILETAFCTNDGFSLLLLAMSQWIHSGQVQESGCILLTEIYFHFQDPSHTAKTAQGPRSSENQCEALNTVCRAMETHPDSIHIQVSGCNAILNLMAPILETSKESIDRQAISLLVHSSYKVILECLLMHGSDLRIQESGISALSVSVSLTETEDFKSWASRIVRRLMDILLESTENHHIHELVLNTLIVIEETHPTVNTEYSNSDVNRLLCLFEYENNEISVKSSKLISSLTRKRPESTHSIVKHHIDNILSKAGSNREDIKIQLNIYSIFLTLFTLNPDHRKVTASAFLHYNGIYDLCMGVTFHPQNRELAISLCKILSLVLPSSDASGIASSHDAIRTSLMNLLESHVENPDVESSIFDVLDVYCCRDNLFKDFLLEDTRLQVLVNTMQFCLGSKSLQASGCNLLSTLSTVASGKEKIGNHGGIPAIVNALLAHNASADVQKRGLVALKNLATVPENKRIIDTNGAEAAVIYALWIHNRDPEVVSIGLSALNNIAVDSVSRSVAKMNDQVLSIVIGAMREFTMNEPVQKNACFYLKTCSYLRDNVQMMCENSDILLALLLQAGDNFPKTCGDRSALVVAKLTSSC